MAPLRDHDWQIFVSEQHPEVGLIMSSGSVFLITRIESQLNQADRFNNGSPSFDRVTSAAKLAPVDLKWSRIRKSVTSLFTYRTYSILFVTALCHFNRSKLYDFRPGLYNDK